MERVKGKCLNFISTQILYLYQPKRSSSVTDKAARTFDFNNSSNSCGQIKVFLSSAGASKGTSYEKFLPDCMKLGSI